MKKAGREQLDGACKKAGKLVNLVESFGVDIRKNLVDSIICSRERNLHGLGLPGLRSLQRSSATPISQEVHHLLSDQDWEYLAC